ncbi:MAG: femAB [Candidatus Taylorbacteria bacterium]|nr:femAB [Candidatus Taylorbacteria bacterium]
MIHLKEITNEKDFVEVNGQNIPLTQTFAYGLIQKRMSRNIKNFQILNDKSVIGSVLIVEYPLFRSLTYWYAPYGPILSNVSEEIILSIKSGLTMWAKKNNVAFVRLDFTFIDSNNSIPLKKYFTESLPPSIVGAYFQPRDEWYTAISGTPEEILSAMHSKTRYSVRLAEKKGIKTVLIDKDLAKKLPAFLELMKQTSVLKGFALHNNDYFK